MRTNVGEYIRNFFEEEIAPQLNVVVKNLNTAKRDDKLLTYFANSYRRNFYGLERCLEGPECNYHYYSALRLLLEFSTDLFYLSAYESDLDRCVEEINSTDGKATHNEEGNQRTWREAIPIIYNVMPSYKLAAVPGLGYAQERIASAFPDECLIGISEVVDDISNSVQETKAYFYAVLFDRRSSRSCANCL